MKYRGDPPGDKTARTRISIEEDLSQRTKLKYWINRIPELAKIFRYDYVGAPGGTRTPNRFLRTELLFH